MPIPTKVLFADPRVSKHQELLEKLISEGIKCDTTTDYDTFLRQLASHPYQICCVNLTLAGVSPFELIKAIKERATNPDLKIVVLTPLVHKTIVENCLKAGAHDILIESLDPEKFAKRLQFHLVSKQVLETPERKPIHCSEETVEWLQALLDTTEILSRTPKHKTHDSLYKILNLISEKLKSNRTSLIAVDTLQNSAVVLASSDDALFRDFPVALDAYPEIQHALATGKVVLIDDVAKNSLTSSSMKHVKTIDIGALMVFPIWHRDEMTGVLLVRRQAKSLPQTETVRITQAIANTMAVHSNMKVLLRRLYKEVPSSLPAET